MKDIYIYILTFHSVGTYNFITDMFVIYKCILYVNALKPMQNKKKS